MKKYFLLFSLIFVSSTFGETVSDFTNMCAETGYKRLYAIFPKNEYTCLPGYFLPADAEECVSCPNGYNCAGGTFYYDATNAQGLAKNSLNSYSAAENACASNTMPKRLYAIMTPITYTCLSGQFLPANSTECATCPNGYNCAGGDFPVDTTKAQGLVRNSEYISSTITNACADNQVRALNAIFTINSYTCQPGYYLPAGNDWLTDTQGCTKCLNDNYCAGGTYTFSETQTQGIIPCPSAHPFAPAGMWLQSQCGRKLHVGDDVLYMHQQPSNPTLHRLFTRVGETDYSANAVLRDMTPGADFPKVSAGATKGLHIKIHETINGIEDDYEYLICDDSVCPNQ